MSDQGNGELDLENPEADLPPPVDITAHVRIVEALLFASAAPLDEASLQNRLPPDVAVRDVLARIADDYDGRGITLVRSGRGWAFRTAPDLAGVLRLEVSVKRKLSRAAVETMAIIAYHQPVTRAEVEEIRGVALSRGTLDTLLEAGWIQPRGRRKVPGRPLQWGTTDGFLDHFGLEGLADLPGVEDLKAAGLLDRRQGLTSIVIPDATDGEDAEDGEEEDQDNLFPLDSDRDDDDDPVGDESRDH